MKKELTICLIVFLLISLIYTPAVLATDNSNLQVTEKIISQGLKDPGFIQGPEEKGNASCGQALKYFPTSLISGVIGSVKTSHVGYSTTNAKLNLNSYDCWFIINDPVGGIATVNVVEYPTIKRARSYYYLLLYGNHSIAPMGIGDESHYSNTLSLSSYVRKGRFVFSVSWWCVCKAQRHISQSQTESILRYATSQVAGDSAEPSQLPTITSITPTTVPAGFKSFLDKSTGIAGYQDSEIKNFKITGTNLQGAKLSVGKGVDGRDLARFIGVSVSADGTTLTSWMYVSTGAPAGVNKITVTNSANLSASDNINITITGTQYLKRKFAKARVQFRGDWPQLSDDPEIKAIESGLTLGLEAINKPAYKLLGVDIDIYAFDFWQDYAKTYCSKSYLTAGCSVPWYSSIIVATGFPDATGHTDPVFLADEIMHESAHKLYFAYQNLYYLHVLNPIVQKGMLSLEKEWTLASGDLKTCQYLPLQKNLSWSNGETSVPRCGFIRSYGAVSINSGPYNFSEDIATMTADSTFYPQFLQRGDTLTDPRYQLKLNILKKYGFL